MISDGSQDQPYILDIGGFTFMEMTRLKKDLRPSTAANTTPKQVKHPNKDRAERNSGKFSGQEKSLEKTRHPRAAKGL
jgi:hypothetical protein